MVQKELNNINSNKCIAYVDGSYNAKTEDCGYGVILFFGNDVLEFSGIFHNASTLGWNVHGEILGSMKAVTEAQLLKAKEIEIRYDYMGIEKWATGEWKANKENTKEYVKFMKEAGKNIQITFTKVKAHSSDKWNDRADVLAKQAVGII